jgi:hypothetical protein
MRLSRIIGLIFTHTTLTGATPCIQLVPSGKAAITGGTIGLSTMTRSSAAARMTIAITNMYGTPLSLAPGVNAGFPTQLNDLQPTVLPSSASIQYVYPTGWGGRISVGETTNVGNSLIEGSYVGGPFIDVSYVDGYSVPITCSCSGITVTGCNIDLFNQPGIPCDDEIEGHICSNAIIRASRPDGPPARFFAACAGAAYTFPGDDRAGYMCSNTTIIACCIGTSCRGPSRQIQKSIARPACDLL